MADEDGVLELRRGARRGTAHLGLELEALLVGEGAEVALGVHG